MIPEKFDCASANRVTAPSELLSSLDVEILSNEGRGRPQEASVKMGAAFIVAALPFVGLWLLLRWAWQDLKAIVRGIRLFYRAVTDELSRQA